MSELPRTSPESSREAMSALADGQADPAAASALWACDPLAREAWHTYHLIGDVLRSDDLAAPAGRDADFLASLRQRLAVEPPIVAPMPWPKPASVLPAGRRWAAPAAVAAGLAAVAAVVVMTRILGSTGDAGPVLAAAPAASGLRATQALGPAGANAATPLSGEPQFQVVDGKLIRDARLDGYLRAHRGGSAAMPGGAIGRFETVVLER